jgi:hypothetical protein
MILPFAKDCSQARQVAGWSGVNPVPNHRLSRLPLSGRGLIDQSQKIATIGILAKKPGPRL